MLLVTLHYGSDKYPAICNCWLFGRFFPESSRWLAQKAESDSAIKGLRVIARVNKRTMQLENALKVNVVFDRVGVIVIVIVIGSNKLLIAGPVNVI